MTRQGTLFLPLMTLFIELYGCSTPPPQNDYRPEIAGMDEGVRLAWRRVESGSEPASYTRVLLNTDGEEAFLDPSSRELYVQPAFAVGSEALLQAVVQESKPAVPRPLETVAGADAAIQEFSEVNFDLGSKDILNPEKLDRLIRLASRLEGVFQVVGYADESGPQRANLMLSKERAEAVSQKLIAAGVHESRVVRHGAGISRLYKTPAENRRASVSFRMTN